MFNYNKNNFELIKKANYISNILHENNFDCYMVGGCVRDLILDRPINDVDFTTNATPEQIQEIYKDFKQIDIGKKFGTIKILYEDEEFEITTYRQDSDYSDGRRPNEVNFTNSIDEDLKRRDFTINSITIHNDELYDPFNGITDMNNKIIKAVGNAEDRINEDLLRSLRAIRFSIQLDFNIDDDLKKAIKNNSNKINKVSKERQVNELNKMLTANATKTFELLTELDLLNYIYPDYKYNNKTKKALLNAAQYDLQTKYAIIFYNKGIDSEKVLKDLKYSNTFVKDVSTILNNYKDEYNKYELRKLYQDISETNLERLLNMKKSNNNENVDKEIKMLKEIKTDNVPKNKKDFNINGNDLIKLGYKPGKQLGLILQDIEYQIFNERINNNKNEIINFINNKYSG